MSALKIAASLRRLLHSAIAHSTREQAANLRFPVTGSNRTDKGQANRPNEARRPKGRPRKLPKRKAIHWSSRCAVHLGITLRAGWRPAIAISTTRPSRHRLLQTMALNGLRFSMWITITATAHRISFMTVTMSCSYRYTPIRRSNIPPSAATPLPPRGVNCRWLRGLAATYIEHGSRTREARGNRSKSGTRNQRYLHLDHAIL